MQKLAATLTEAERRVLRALDEQRDAKALAKKSSLSEVEVVRAMQWLENKGLISIEATQQQLVTLDRNGEAAAKDGLPERRLLRQLAKHDRLRLADADLDRQEANIAVGTLKRKGGIEIGEGMSLTLTEAGRALATKQSLEEQLLATLTQGPLELDALAPEQRYAYDELSRRKQMLKTVLAKRKIAIPTPKGRKLRSSGNLDEQRADRLTPAMLTDGSWRKRPLRRYDVTINVPARHGGRVHFVTEAIEYIKRIWLELGFKEMTGTMVQTSFWSHDALFTAQDHPVREMQDTFYLDEHGDIPAALAKQIKAVHEHGGKTGSTGWQQPWSEEVARRLQLRPHTTCLSAQTLASLKASDLPAKFFSVGKVYRNEAVDWKHLFEFNQVEGIVVDPDATMRHLKGYLSEFYRKMGFTKVRMRPGYFPYTEPSVEPEVYHPGKQQWVEMGGAGIFRPEVTTPLLGRPIPVLAWGLGMERIITSYFGIDDLRDLYRNDLQQLRAMKRWMR